MKKIVWFGKLLLLNRVPQNGEGSNKKWNSAKLLKYKLAKYNGNQGVQGVAQQSFPYAN